MRRETTIEPAQMADISRMNMRPASIESYMSIDSDVSASSSFKDLEPLYHFKQGYMESYDTIGRSYSKPKSQRCRKSDIEL